MKKVILFLTLFSLSIQYTYSQWVQQSLPVSGFVYDICFFDANTGLVSMDTPALLRTTNGGVNWTVANNLRIYNFNKIDSMAVYSNGRLTGVDKIYRSYDKGVTWDSVSPASNGAYFDLAFVNRDTGWVSGFNGMINVIFRSTNGGTSLEQQSTATGFGTIFFLKTKINGQYHGWNANSYLFYTTNSGVNWNLYTNLPNQNAGSIFFLNKDTGWVSNSSIEPYIMYTSNNGVNWTIQNLLNSLGAGDILFLNYKKGWAASGFGNVVATTNSGINWGRQIVPIFTINAIYFADSLIGWCGGNGICKTTNGGGNIIFNGIQQISNKIPTACELYQNYPNPFNPTTNIKYQIVKNSIIKLIIYDILGREVRILVNEIQSPGTYLVDFNASVLPSGVYIYRLITDNYIKTRKMILTK